MKNELIQILVRLLRPTHPPVRQSRHILVVSTTGLGDTLWGTPALRAIREKHPTAHLSVLTSPIGKEVLEHNPHIDTLLVVKDPVFTQLIPLYCSLKKKEISDVLLFHTSQRALLPLCAVIGAERVIGTAGLNKGLDPLLTQPLLQRPMHEIERRLEIVKQIGAHSSSPLLELPLSPEDEETADKFLSSFDLPSYLPLVSLHPGAKDRFKQWPPSHFVSLGHLLIHHLGCRLFITGTPAERPLVEQIAKQIPGAIPVTHLKLRPFAALLKRMKLMITNDTGPMHLSFAMQTPTVALFAPTDPSLCGPYHVKAVRVLNKERTCTPCLKKRCREPFCMLQIGVQEVAEAALDLFYKPHSFPINARRDP